MQWATRPIAQPKSMIIPASLLPASLLSEPLIGNRPWLCASLLLAMLVTACSDDDHQSNQNNENWDAGSQADSGTNTNGTPTVTGDLIHGSSVVVSGSGFGQKDPAAPFRASYQHPDQAQRFQEMGAFDDRYWSLGAADIMVNLADDLPDSRVKGRASQQYYARLEYSARGNWEAGGYSAGVQTNLPESKVLYLSWWDYFEPGFEASHMATGAANFKWIYMSPGQNPHEAMQIINDGTDLLCSALGGIAGDTNDEQNANLDIPGGGGFYGRPLSWTSSYALPIGRWYHVELFYRLNSAPKTFDGSMELRIDNQRIFRVQHIDVYDSESTPNEYFDNIRFGGNYGFDESGSVFYRQYGGIYLDGTFARVVLGDAPNYDDCRHLEVQIATQWSNGSITFTLNEGSFQAGDTAYLYVFDASGQQHGPASLVLE